MKAADEAMITQKQYTAGNAETQRIFSESNEISRHLYCVICQEVLGDPQRLDCGHTFCLRCISQWAKKNAKCPTCRVSFSLSQMSRDLIAFNIINDLEVLCCNSGCPWKGALLDLNEHLKSCFFINSELPSKLRKHFDSYSDLGPNDVSSNPFLSFNSKVGLKARLYQKNKELMQKIFEESNKKRRDSISAMIYGD